MTEQELSLRTILNEVALHHITEEEGLSEILALIKEAGYVERKKILAEFTCLQLAPNDDAYYRILNEGVLDFLKTGKTQKERADERWQAFQDRMGIDKKP